MQYMNNLHSSYFKDEKEKKMEKIKYPRGIVVGKDEIEDETIGIDENRMLNVGESKAYFKIEGREVPLETRTRGDFKGIAIYLTGVYDWMISKDNEGSVCLIPLKKETPQKWER